MIDAILYRKNLHGRLTLRERRFAGFQELTDYLASPKAARWEWVEVEVPLEPGCSQTLYYSYTANDLREMVAYPTHCLN